MVSLLRPWNLKRFCRHDIQSTAKIAAWCEMRGLHSSHGDELSQHSTFRTQVRILGMVSNPVPDARRAGPGIAWKERRTAPRHAAVWGALVAGGGGGGSSSGSASST